MKYNADKFNAGYEIWKIRNKKGMTREAFASKLGIKAKDLEAIEEKVNTGQGRSIGINKLLAWCDNYDCDLEYLLGFQEKERKDFTDIHAVTGLSTHTINRLKYEKDSNNSNDYIISDVNSAVIVNSLFDTPEGDALMISMQMYVIANNILKLHRRSIESAIKKINYKYEQNYEADYILNVTARRIMQSAKQTTAIVGMRFFGRNQNKIATTKERFIELFKLEHFNKKTAEAIYNYLEAEDRLKVLKNDCYDNLVKLLESVPSNQDGMKYNGSLKQMAEFFGFSDMKLKPAIIDVEDEE